MSQSSVDQGPFSHDAFDDFLAEVNASDAMHQEAESAESERILRLTDQLRDSPIQAICLSYPDGTRNETVIRQLESGSTNWLSADLCSEAVISNEQWLYGACLELLGASNNPNDDRFLRVNEGKKQLIAIWMMALQIPFDSPWVDFLGATMPGGDVTISDVDEAMDFIRDENIRTEDTIDTIANIIKDGLGDASDDNVESFRQRAKQFMGLTIALLEDLGSRIDMPDGEIDYRLHQMRVSCGVSDGTQRECLKYCAIRCGYNLSKLDIDPSS